jgi:hypothetical protein
VDGGTVFLDEIGELPPRAGPCGCDSFRHRKAWPWGTRRGMRVDVRVIAATHREREAAAALGMLTFRSGSDGFRSQMILDRLHAGSEAGRRDHRFALRPRMDRPGQGPRTVLDVDPDPARLAFGAPLQGMLDGPAVPGRSRLGWGLGAPTSALEPHHTRCRRLPISDNATRTDHHFGVSVTAAPFR